MQHFGEVDEERERRDGEEQGTHGEDKDAEHGDVALAADGVDQRAGRKLACHRRDGPEAEGKTDRGLRPALRRQVDGNERAETGLNIGNEEVEPIEAARRR